MAMAARDVLDGKARFEGRTLAEWVPDAVSSLVIACRPRTIVVFGLMARGDDGPDSDIDLLVVMADAADRRVATKAALRAVAPLPPEVDVVVVGRAAAEVHRDVAGTIIRPALREGKVVYDRAG